MQFQQTLDWSHQLFSMPGAKGLSEIAANAKELAEKARTNKLKPNEF